MGSFEILESYVGERVNKIRFVGSINKEIRLEVSVRVSDFWKGRKRIKGRRPRVSAVISS